MSGTVSSDPPETGEPRVDEALRSVADLDDVPVDEHAERLGSAHADLQQVLRRPVDGSEDAAVAS